MEYCISSKHPPRTSALKKKKEDLHAVTTPDFVQEDPPTGAWAMWAGPWLLEFLYAPLELKHRSRPKHVPKRCDRRRGPYFVLHMLLLLIHASLAQPGLRPARPHGKPIATYVERGEPLANERGPGGRAVAVHGMHREFGWDALNVTERHVHREFSWDALNVTKDTECGGKKCYFPSLQGEREGWLVGTRGFGAVPPHPGDGSLTQWSRAWARAEELRAHFGVDHLLRGPPFLATLSPEQATHLNAKIRARLDRERNPYLKVWAQYYVAGPHPVQAVHSCSWPECMVLRCRKSLTDQAVDDFLANAPNKTKLGLGIKKNFALVAAMAKAHPCLKIDFQVYLRNDGTVLNIDLDRCDDPISKQHNISLAQMPGLCGARHHNVHPLALPCTHWYPVHPCSPRLLLAFSTTLHRAPP